MLRFLLLRGLDYDQRSETRVQQVERCSYNTRLVGSGHSGPGGSHLPAALTFFFRVTNMCRA